MSTRTRSTYGKGSGRKNGKKAQEDVQELSEERIEELVKQKREDMILERQAAVERVLDEHDDLVRCLLCLRYVELADSLIGARILPDGKVQEHVGVRPRGKRPTERSDFGLLKLGIQEAKKDASPVFQQVRALSLTRSCLDSPQLSFIHLSSRVTRICLCDTPKLSAFPLSGHLALDVLLLNGHRYLHVRSRDSGAFGLYAVGWIVVVIRHVGIS